MMPGIASLPKSEGNTGWVHTSKPTGEHATDVVDDERGNNLAA